MRFTGTVSDPMMHCGHNSCASIWMDYEKISKVDKMIQSDLAVTIIVLILYLEAYLETKFHIWYAAIAFRLISSRPWNMLNILILNKTLKNASQNRAYIPFRSPSKTVKHEYSSADHECPESATTAHGKQLIEKQVGPLDKK